MEIRINVFDTGNLISLLSTIAAFVSLALCISDRLKRRTRFGISGVRIYTMSISRTDSHILLAFCLVNKSSRPLSLETLHIRLNKADAIRLQTSIEAARTCQGISPSNQITRMLVGSATAFPVLVPAHGAVQIDALFCLKPAKHSIDLLEFRSLASNMQCTQSDTRRRSSKATGVSLDLILSVHGRSFYRSLSPDMVDFVDPSDIDGDQEIHI